MAEVSIIYGKSGSGKSRSLINFGEDEVLLINTIGKRLPFRKKFNNTFDTDSPREMAEAMKATKCPVIVIDDAGYIMTNKFMAGHRGSNQFDLYNDIADSMWKLINYLQKLDANKTVYLIFHDDQSDYGETKLRTIGKLLNDKVCIEGMVTICLHCVKQDDGYFFITQNQNDISKSPEGMLSEKEPNDLKAVDTKIRKYYEMEMLS